MTGWSVPVDPGQKNSQMNTDAKNTMEREAMTEQVYNG